MDKQETKQKLQPKAEPIDNACPPGKPDSSAHHHRRSGRHESLGDRTNPPNMKKFFRGLL